MNILQIILLIIVALSGIPVGLLISKYTKDEIKKGKLELKILMAVSAVLFLTSLFFKFSQQPLIMTVSTFIFTLSLISLQKAKI